MHSGNYLKKLSRLFHTHLQHIRNCLILVGNFQSFMVEAASPADLTGNCDIRQEVHLDSLHSLPGALFTSSAGYVKGEAASGVPPDLCLGSCCKQRPYLVIESNIGSRAGARGFPNWGLVYLQGSAKMLDAAHLPAADALGALQLMGALWFSFGLFDGSFGDFFCGIFCDLCGLCGGLCRSQTPLHVSK